MKAKLMKMTGIIISTTLPVAVAIAAAAFGYGWR